MSVTGRTPAARAADRLGAIDPVRAAVLVCAAVLTGSYLVVLYRTVDAVGGVTALAALVAGALVLAAVVARFINHRQAVGVAGVLLAAGLGGYLLVVPTSYYALLTVQSVVGDTVALLTGFSILGMTKAGTWALSVAPGPVFLTWYFALRREYAASATVGGVALGFFVLTGDSTSVETLLGVLAAAGMVGFGTLARHGGDRRQVEALAVAFALMILASATVSAVPGGGESPIVPKRATSVEAELISADEQLGVGGSIRLSPTVRFVVNAEEPAYWRAGAYDRYTGDGWVRSGKSRSYDGGRIASVPGAATPNRQVVSIEAPTSVLPAANQPVRLTGVDARVTELGGVQPAGSLQAGDEYEVVSRMPEASPQRLNRAGTAYPDDVTERYLQLPESTTDRLREFTANLTASAETPYQTAALVEEWLRTNKRYSLSVDRPDGNIADSFLFEMEAGYCTYYATTMVTMLRSQGVPARFVVGYAPGQRVAEDQWVVRGLDSHAWVEVYFPDVGWVRFDPTPSADRRSAERDRVRAAREAGVDDVDAAGSENGTWTPTTTSDDVDEVTGNVSPVQQGRAGDTGLGTVAAFQDQLAGDSFEAQDPALGGSDGSGGRPVELPPPGTMAVWGVLIAGILAVGRRSGAVERVYREAWLRVEPRGDPAEQVVGAFDRVEYLLAREHRARRSTETVREYLGAIDAGPRARRVAEIHERSRYAGDVSRTTAVEARRLAADLAGERSPASRRRS